MNRIIKLFGNSVLFACTLFLLNGCSSDNNKNTTTPNIDTVVLKQMKFFPDTLAVKTGDTVVWINKGLVDHDVTSYKPGAFYSDTIHVGNIWKMVVTDSASYHCSIHPTMKGKIVLN